MKIFNTKTQVVQWTTDAKYNGKQVGFVPTMGALHQGHLALVKRALRENDMVICSIFVNPLQFNNPTDLEKYPRDLDKDLQLLDSLNCDAVFCPEEKEMYPQLPDIVYDFGQIDNVMEGKFRPGHFNGVAIVVNELFNIVQANRAYFGQKDYQQLQIIRQLVAQQNIDIEIISCPIIRESDGLAMSSRNVRLTPEQRMQAPKIYHVLKQAREQYKQKPIGEIKLWVESQINSCELMQLEYFEIADARTLQPAGNPPPPKVIACIAVKFGQLRLIDNLFFN